MQDSEMFDRAIAAHAKWKYRLMDAVETGQSDATVVQARSDGQCEFGRWLAGLSLSERLSPAFQKVRALHTDFHTAAADVLELALAGRKEEAAAALALSSHFAKVSSSLTLAVVDWQKTRNAQ